MKSKILLFTYCLTISAVFHVSSFPDKRFKRSTTTKITKEDIEELQEIKDPRERFRVLKEYGVNAIKELLTDSFPEEMIEKFNELGEFEDIFGNEYNDAQSLAKFQEKGVGTVAKIIQISQLMLKQIDAELEKSENSMRVLRQSTYTIDLQTFNATTKFFEKFNIAQLDLIDARKELTKLAADTIHLCRAMETNIEYWDEKHAAILIKDDFAQLERLVETSIEKLNNAEKKYSHLIETWTKIDDDIGTFILQLKKAEKMNKAQYQELMDNLETGRETWSGWSVFLDIISFGIAGNRARIAKVNARINAQLSEVKRDLALMKNTIEVAMKNLNHLDEISGAAVILITFEQNQVLVWQSAAENIQRQIEDYTIDQLRVVKSFRKQFKDNLIALREAAEAFQNATKKYDPLAEVANILQ